jgi:hypothetical protein
MLDGIAAPEVSYRIDALVWYRDTQGFEYPSLPEYRPSPNKMMLSHAHLLLGHRHFVLRRLAGDEILWLRGLSVEGPIGKKRTWKVVYCCADFSYILARFGLEWDRGGEILRAISWTPDGKILRYSTKEAAKEAVERALIKIGLVGPVPEPDEMHMVTGYDA